MHPKHDPGTPVKNFTIPTSDSSTINVSIAEPKLRADNLHLATWTSSYVLASQLHKLKICFGHDDYYIPVLELGAGTGLVGLTAASLWRKRVVLTDLPGIVPGLWTNVDLNPRALAATSNNIQCGSLDWNSADTLHFEDGAKLKAGGDEGAQASIVVAADTIYDEAHPELLSNAILTWLARTSDARAILCYPLRVAYLDQIREVWAILEEAGLEAESEGQQRAEQKDWDDECLCEWVVWKWKKT